MSKSTITTICTFAASAFITLLAWMLIELNTLGKQVEGLKKAAIYSEQGFEIVISTVESNKKIIDFLAVQSALNKDRTERNERAVDRLKDNTNAKDD